MCMQNESVVKSVVNEDSMMNLSVTDAPAEDLSKLTVPKLKARLKELGAPVNGKKADLIERLTGLLVVEAVVEEVAALEEVMPDQVLDAPVEEQAEQNAEAGVGAMYGVVQLMLALTDGANGMRATTEAKTTATANMGEPPLLSCNVDLRNQDYLLCVA